MRRVSRLILKIFSNRRWFSAALLAAMLASCAPTVEKKVWDLTWPLPPDEPRIKYVEILQSSADVGEQGGVAEALFGSDVMVLSKPYGVAVDKEGRVFVTDAGAVFVFDKKNRKFSMIGVEPGVGKLNTPAGVAVSKVDGRVYVTDIGLKRLYIYDREGKYLNAIGKENEFTNPIGVVVDDKRGRVYVVDSKKRNVRAYSTDGRFIMDIDLAKDGLKYFHTPTELALDSVGNIYVSDTQAFSIKIFDPDGNFQKIIGKLGDVPGNFARPKGVALDSEDHMYVVDAAFNNFQIFNKEGQVLLFVGAGGSNPGEFNLPAGIAIDDEDRIYVTEQYNARVQVFQYMSEKWKRAHPDLWEKAQQVSREAPVKKEDPPEKKAPVNKEDKAEEKAE
ncbi:NHL repeat protein [Candidatus Sulfobium mesophilum]|uniref:NHL repeat protein n=1 Tax=Candidatus Sulfobium mesophilum TaxID=2016548 RepID=A0A2U3QEG3_9BACT|nr:NHL repeat protein [Candidatus Sulfobium mesophilum]